MSNPNDVDDNGRPTHLLAGVMGNRMMIANVVLTCALAGLLASNSVENLVMRVLMVLTVMWGCFMTGAIWGSKLNHNIWLKAIDKAKVQARPRRRKVK